MAQQTIDIGTEPNDGTGDTPRVGGEKINANFSELYNFANQPAVALVRTSGDDVTGSIANGQPYLTIDAALDALPASGGVIDIGLGDFDSPTKSKIKTGVWFRGAKQPHPNHAITPTTWPTPAVSVPTKLTSGTVLKGTFDIPYDAEHITISDLGVDVGSDWCTASNGGTAVNALMCVQDYDLDAGGESPYLSATGVNRLQTDTNPRIGMVFRNLTCLVKSPTDLFHAFSVNHCYEPTVSGIYTYHGFAGVIIKTIGGVYTDIHAHGHNQYGIIIKSNDYAWCNNVVLDGFEITSVTSDDGAGLFFDAADTGSPGLFGVAVSNGVIHDAKFGVSMSASPASSITELRVSDVIVARCSGIGFNVTTAAIYSSFANCHARGCSGDGFYSRTASGVEFMSCVASGNTGDGFDVSATTRVNLVGCVANVNGGPGFRAGSNVYSNGHHSTNATSGTITAF